MKYINEPDGKYQMYTYDPRARVLAVMRTKIMPPQPVPTIAPVSLASRAARYL